MTTKSEQALARMLLAYMQEHDQRDGSGPHRDAIADCLCTLCIAAERVLSEAGFGLAYAEQTEVIAGPGDAL